MQLAADDRRQSQEHNRDISPQRWLWAALIVISAIVAPALGIFGPFDSGENFETSARELFSPAGYVFSIWGVIYLGLVALGVWIALPAQRDNPRVRRAAPWLAATAVFNVVWLIAAGNRAFVLWTVPIILVMEVTAWIAYLRLDIHHNATLPRTERALHVPMQIYVGWLAVATVANIASALNRIGWDGWGIDPVTWTVIMLIAATAIALVVGRLVHDNIFRAVFVWAYIGIVVDIWDVPAVAWTAAALAAVLTLVIIATTIRRRTAAANETA